MKKIPLDNAPQEFAISLAGQSYNVKLSWHNGWHIDVSKHDDRVLAGVPLVTGVDLLYPYANCGIGGALVVLTDGHDFRDPTKDSLGDTSHLFFVEDADG